MRLPLFIHPLKRQWDNGHAGLVLAKALPKTFFQLVLLHPDHQGKCEERADCQQNITHHQAAANGPAAKIQKMRNVNGMAHARVQACSDQFLRVLPRTQLRFTAQLVAPKPEAYAGIGPEPEEHRRAAGAHIHGDE